MAVGMIRLAVFLLVTTAAYAWLRLLGLWPIRVGYVAARPDWDDPFDAPYGEITWR